MKNNLDAVMQARLDKWRANPLPVKTLLKLQKKGMFIPRKANPNDEETPEELEKLKKLHNNTGNS